MTGDTQVAEAAPVNPPDQWSRTARFRGLVRTNWLFTALLVVGFGLRVIAWLAYQPALIYTDSYYYLDNVGPLAPQFLDPIGYPLFVLKPLIPIGGIALVSAVQHLAGIFMAFVLYRIALRCGARRWLAALVAAPVLLDGFQLQIEQNILSDVWLQVLLVVLMWLLVGRARTFGWRAAAGAGLVVGLAMTVRMVAITLIVPVALYVLLAGRQWKVPGGWRRIGARFGALAATFLIVVGGYAAYFHSQAGYWGLSTASGNSLYGRAADVADCAKLDLDSTLAQLCPKEPPGHRLGPNVYAHLDGDPNWPGYVPPGETKYDLMRQFARKVIEKQPLTVAKAMFIDFAKGFAPYHWWFNEDPPTSLWQFQTVYPVYTMDPNDVNGDAYAQTDAEARAFGGRGISFNAGLGTFLHYYQLVIYTPGPLLAILGILGLLAGFGFRRARKSGLAADALLVSGLAIFVLGTAAVFMFSWRYQLPGLVLFPLAGVIGITALRAAPKTE